MGSESSTKDRRLEYIPVAKVVPNPAALRQVDRSSEKYIELVESIKSRGILKPILVHEDKDKETGQTVYGLSDGLHRFTGAQDAGLTEIPAHIVPMEESEVLITQVIANAHTIETRAADYSTALVRILGQQPSMTLSNLAEKLNRSPQWLQDRLSLVKLSDTLKQDVNENRINLSNAYVLAKLPPEEQENWRDRAMTEAPDVFTPAVTTRVKQLREAARQGRKDVSETYIPTPHMQKMGDLKDEIESNRVAQVFKGKGLIQNVEDFELGVRWAMKVDPESVAAAQKKWEEDKSKRDDSKKARELERTKSKLAEAQESLKKMGIDPATVPA